MDAKDQTDARCFPALLTVPSRPTPVLDQGIYSSIWRYTSVGELSMSLSHLDIFRLCVLAAVVAASKPQAHLRHPQADAAADFRSKNYHAPTEDHVACSKGIAFR